MNKKHIKPTPYKAHWISDTKAVLKYSERERRISSMKLLAWGIIGAAAIFGVMKRYGMSNNAQQMTPSSQQSTTPVQLVANSNPLTANTPKQ